MVLLRFLPTDQERGNVHFVFVCKKKFDFWNNKIYQLCCFIDTKNKSKTSVQMEENMIVTVFSQSVCAKKTETIQRDKHYV